MWVSSDVLMCTASIWHMCTMSMDRYFTLKYPMRYGRNKTKTMVMLKIFFVWVVSMAISSPICIHGFVDPTIVYNDGVCVPVLKDFVIYGSVFAFYIPLFIMIVTYVLTIRILWANQQLMNRINQTDLRPGLAQMTAQCTGFAMPQMPHLINPLLDEANSETENFNSSTHSNGGVVHAQTRSILNTALLMPPPLSPQPLSPQPSPPQSPSSPQHIHLQQVHTVAAIPRPRSQGQLSADTDSDEEEVDLPSTCLLQEKSMSYKSLCARAAMSNSAEEFFMRAATPGNVFSRLTPSEKSGSFRDHRERHHKPTHLDVPSQVLFRRGRIGPALYSAASDTQIPSSRCCSTPETGRPSFHQSFNGLESDYKSAEWDRRFFQIQQEMDACLLDGGDTEASAAHPRDNASSTPGGGGHTTNSLGDLNASEAGGSGAEALFRSRKYRPTVPSNLLIARQHGKNPRCGSKARCHAAPKTKHKPVHTSDSDNEADTSGSSNSDVITIRLHPPNSPHKDSGQHSTSEDLTENSVLRSVVVSSEADNTQEDSDVLNTNDESPANDSRERAVRRSGKHKRLLKARFRNTLRASARPMFKHLLSKKTASNERKASKVLGIIFLVFVILWTPFFIVNILSVTCSTCMKGLTGDMMSVFIWMGYVASLANPIIYTMFNTAFRRTFIKILTCRIQRSRRMKFSDLPTFPSMTTTAMPSERRGTMTVLLDHRT